MSLADGELVGLVARGDREAFARLFDRHAPRVLGFLIKLVRARSEAEDLLQDVFYQVWTTADRYDPQRAKPLAWLLLIARSRAMDHLRRRKRRATSTLESDVPDGGDAAEHLELADWSQFAGRALQSLPREQSSLIGLAFYGGLTHEQIAQRESLPLGTVKTRIRRGIQKLKDILSGQIMEPTP
ncbi:MAG: sigma-70 family RNA polymerase sigma factor [Phycisphaerales bacterium]|nr:sigma-70 family RNA polymerase sigma factor [Phycisphaerales bacterium]